MWHILGIFVLVRGLWQIVRNRLRRDINADTTILVTGCDSGFGFSIVRALREKTGALIVAGAVTENGLQRLKSLGRGRVIPVTMDVTKDSDVEKVFAEVEAIGNPLVGVINNAGIGTYGWCEVLDLDRYSQNIEVNLMGVIRVTKRALPLLRKSKGRLVTMGSLAGRVPSAFGSSYAPTKAAVASFQSCVRQEVYRFGVRCSLIEPGFFATGMLHRSAELGRSSCVASETDSGISSAYCSYAQKMAKTSDAVSLAEKFNGGEKGIQHVVEAVLDALTTQFPRSRYLCGVDANILGRIGPIIPDFVWDLLQTYVI